MLPRFVVFEDVAGLAVTYGLNLNIIQAWMIWELSNLETKIISVERILQYTSIPSEPPLVVEENRPQASWPLYGTIDIHNLQVVLIYKICTKVFVFHRLKLVSKHERQTPSYKN
jgi:hypothetical protein